MKILVTGFEPFCDKKINSSWEAVKRLPDRISTPRGTVEIIKRELPVYYRLSHILERLIKEVSPSAVLMIGQNEGISQLNVEYVAINYCDAPVPDNDGVIYSGEPMAEGGANAYFATYPAKKIVRAMLDNGFNAAFSLSAGAFVCNSSFYLLMKLLNGTSITGGFIHVPFLSESAAEYEVSTHMPLGQIVRALETAITVYAENI